MGETKAQREQREEEERAAALAVQGDEANAPDEGDELKLRVPQDDGEIVLSRGSEVTLTKRVTNGVISAKDADEYAMLLGSVPGAQRV